MVESPLKGDLAVELPGLRLRTRETCGAIALRREAEPYSAGFWRRCARARSTTSEVLAGSVKRVSGTVGEGAAVVAQLHVYLQATRREHDANARADPNA